MSIPRTRTFNNKKGFQAQADVGINSPSQTNSQSVNVIVRGIELTQDKRFEGVLNQANVEHKKIESCPKNNLNLEAVPLNNSVDEIVKERSVDTAKKSLEEMETLLKNTDNLVEALSLILDIYENNPLIVNKYIVAQEEELTRLLFLLTGAEQIEIIKSDQDSGCTYKVGKFSHIQKIIVTKNGNTYNFKYSFPNSVQLLDNRRISWKIVV